MPFLSLLATVTLGLRLLGLPFSVMAQDAPLFVQGGFEDATATDDSYNTGGTISVNGFTITVPINVLVQFPAAWVPWKDFVEDKEAMVGYEIEVSRAASIPDLGERASTILLSMGLKHLRLSGHKSA